MASLGAEQRETDVGTARFSLLIVHPPGPLGDTNHIRDFTDSDVMIVELGADRISLHASHSFLFSFVAGAEVSGLVTSRKCWRFWVCCVVSSSV